MTLDGNTRRACRFRTKAFTVVLSDDVVVAADTGPACALRASLDGDDEPRARLDDGADVVHRADHAAARRRGSSRTLRPLRPTSRPHAAATGREPDPQMCLLHAVAGVHRGPQLPHPWIGSRALAPLASSARGTASSSASEKARVNRMAGSPLLITAMRSNTRHLSLWMVLRRRRGGRPGSTCPGRR